MPAAKDKRLHKIQFANRMSKWLKRFIEAKKISFAKIENLIIREHKPELTKWIEAGNYSKSPEINEKILSEINKEE